jgi:very-short-patch-repair endonuclease
MTKLKPRSEHEELFAMQLKAAKLRGWEREVVFAPPRRWRFDFANYAYKLAVEIEGATWSGGRHNRGAGYEKDCEKYNTAIVYYGWRVLRFTAKMVADGIALRMVEDATNGLGNRLEFAKKHRN